MENERPEGSRKVMPDYLLAWLGNPENSAAVKNEFIKRYRIFRNLVKNNKSPEEIQRAEKHFDIFAAECGFQNLNLDPEIMDAIQDLKSEADFENFYLHVKNKFN